MKTTFKQLWADEDGFIVSAELVLVSTITVLSMIVGLTALSHSINKELYDVANAFQSVNQWDEDEGSGEGGYSDRIGQTGPNADRWDVVAQ